VVILRPRNIYVWYLQSGVKSVQLKTTYTDWPQPEKSAYRHVGIARFPVDGKPVSQALAQHVGHDVLCCIRRRHYERVQNHEV
jgi:hypothetical protein